MIKLFIWVFNLFRRKERTIEITNNVTLLHSFNSLGPVGVMVEYNEL